MAILLIFLLGIGNFALHRAVLESGHPLLAHMSGPLQMLGGKASLVAEFVVLLAVMLLVANGHLGWGWAYAIYSMVNGFTAWLILTRRL